MSNQIVPQYVEQTQVIKLDKRFIGSPHSMSIGNNEQQPAEYSTEELINSAQLQKGRIGR